MKDLIALSGKQFSGKDTVADLLIGLMPELRKIPLARAIKLEFGARYRLTPQDIEANKALYRTGLIALGQRRRQQNPDYWLERALAEQGPKIISDMRLKHEYETLKAHGAFMIRVEASRNIRAERGELVKENDPTECELDDICNWDATIQNDGSEAELKAQIEKLAKNCF